jgi:hypothetical protein
MDFKNFCWRKVIFLITFQNKTLYFLAIASDTFPSKAPLIWRTILSLEVYHVVMDTVYCYRLIEIFMRLVFWTNRNGNKTHQLIPVKVNGKWKLKEFVSHNLLNISLAKAVN